MSALLASQSFTQGVYEFIGNLNVVLDELELLKSNSEKKYFGKNDLSFNKSIKFKNVNFNYKENQNVGLSDVSLEFDKGRKYFIVGETASGKSTFIKLILGLLRVNSGYIEIDGKNLYSGNIENWRSKIGYVAQDLYIYNDTIMSNITLVDNANAVLRDKAREVSKLVLLDNYFESLDHKYDTNIQDHGASMSGGQRQRIYLAREILKGSEILILDEATSALDSETERIIVENLLNYNSNATIIFISHNTHLSKYFDQTIVFHEGKVTIRD